ncbi:Sulfoxide reductase catalytic subunit yedY precursor [Providencia alcalifaciens]|nr:Sulfoxide reductase catalytic subunit yedY precursor [Providencia alcalifaciens]
MKKLPKIPATHITDESVFFMKRRQLLKALGVGAAGLTIATNANAGLFSWFNDDTPAAPTVPRKVLTFTQPTEFQSSLTLTPEDKVTGYNNFYEFGLGKSDPAENAHTLVTDEWTVTIDGEVNRPPHS